MRFHSVRFLVFFAAHSEIVNNSGGTWIRTFSARITDSSSPGELSRPTTPSINPCVMEWLWPPLLDNRTRSVFSKSWSSPHWARKTGRLRWSASRAAICIERWTRSSKSMAMRWSPRRKRPRLPTKLRKKTLLNYPAMLSHFSPAPVKTDRAVRIQ